MRAGGRCESAGCPAGIDEVHHRRYPKVWGEEPIECLWGLCKKHHDDEHPTWRRGAAT